MPSRCGWCKHYQVLGGPYRQDWKRTLWSCNWALVNQQWFLSSKTRVTGNQGKNRGSGINPSYKSPDVQQSKEIGCLRTGDCFICLSGFLWLIFKHINIPKLKKKKWFQQSDCRWSGRERRKLWSQGLGRQIPPESQSKAKKLGLG